MITTKINIKPHLAEYLIGKYGTPGEPLVQLPPDSDLYLTVYDLTARRPADCPVDAGNLELALPDPRAARRQGGKPVSVYNYLSQRSAGIIAQKISVMLRAELHDLMDENKHVYGIDYLNTAYYFLRRYSIESLSVDALLKDYQRWKKRVRRQRRHEAEQFRQ